MSRSFILACFLVFLISSFGLTAQSEKQAWSPPKPGELGISWVQLSSGEWLGGEIISMYDDKLELKSQKLGVLKIDWENITRIYTKEEISARFSDETMHQGFLVVEDGQVRVISVDHETAMPQSSIVSLTTLDHSGLENWKIKASVGINVTQGNTEQIDYNVMASIKRIDADSRLVASYLTFISLKDDALSESNRRFSGYYDILLNKDYFLRPIMAKYFSDKFQNIDYRLTLGTGVGYKLLDTLETEWNLVIGLGYQSTRFDNVEVYEDDTDNTPAFIFETDYETELTNKTDLIIRYDFALLSETSGRYSHHLASILSTEISEYFDFDISFIWDRIQEPTAYEDGEIPKKDDYRLVFGVGAKY